MRCLAKSVTLGPLLVLGTSLWAADGLESNATAHFPQPHPSKSPIIGAYAFVGSRACAACHAEAYRLWESSTHGRAGGLPTPRTIISTFDGTVLRFNDALVKLSTNSKGQYFFRVEQVGRAPTTFQVDALVGGGHMVGGGTQASFGRFPDGSWRLLPFDYSKHADAWFCSTGERNWVPIDVDLSITECQDWPPQWRKGFLGFGCQNCHGSQIAVDYDPAERRYQTNHNGFAIGCESCHGPGKEHIERVESVDLSKVEDIAMESLSLLDKDESLAVCFQCHAQKVKLKPGYLPGKRFEDYYALTIPLLDSLHADGRVADFGYQKNHLYSDCYLNGSMTCVDCHDPHAQHYRDVTGTALQGRFDNQQCLGCHASKAAAPGRHSHHRPDSPGSRCTSCHMPYLQHRGVGERIPFARSDHSIPIPRPAFDQRLGIENACQNCHKNRDIQWQEARIQAWYGELKPHKAVIDGLVKLETSSDRVLLLKLLLETDGSHPMALLDVLGRVADDYIKPGVPTLESALVAKLKALSTHDNMDLRSTALMILDLDQGEQPDIRAYLDERLARLGDSDSAVRSRWAAMLWLVAKKYEREDKDKIAARVFKKALNVWPDYAEAHSSLGDYYFEHEGKLDASMRHFQEALKIGPTNKDVHAELSFKIGRIHQLRNQDALAMTAYGLAIELAPENTRELRLYCRVYDRLAGAGSSTPEVLPKCLISNR